MKKLYGTFCIAIVAILALVAVSLNIPINTFGCGLVGIFSLLAIILLR